MKNTDFGLVAAVEPNAVGGKEYMHSDERAQVQTVVKQHIHYDCVSCICLAKRTTCCNEIQFH